MSTTTLRSIGLIAESVVFTFLVPGTVTIWLPMILLGDTVAMPMSCGVSQYAAFPVGCLGIAMYVWCLRDFVTSGRGIPAPIDHPRRLVVRGLYGYVRNPMYLAVLCVLAGEIIFFESRALFLYTITWFGVVHLVVVLYEEPALRRKFGDQYEVYLRAVPRWLPGRPRVDAPT